MSIVGDEPCPKCRERGGDKTGNHLIIFKDGNKHCSRCGYTQLNGKTVEEKDDDLVAYNSMTLDDVAKLPFFGIPHRMISKEACEYYGVRTEFDGKGEPVAWYYPHYQSGRLTGYKRKCLNKSQQFSIGDTKGGELFGQSSIKHGGKFAVITEGEEDALAVWDTLRQHSDLKDWYPSVMSIPHGIAAAPKDTAINCEALEKYERIILCFDSDEPGQEGAKLTAQMFPDRAFITRLALKDANDMLMQGKGIELKWDILSHAKRYQPDGIVNGADTWDRYKNASNMECFPYPVTWTELNRLTYGYRLGQVVTLTAGTGVGKTQFIRELKNNVFESTDWKIADISLEEDVGESVAGLMSLRMGQRLHLPDVVIDESHERKVHEELFGSGRFSFYDHFGGMDDQSLFSKLRYFGATGHRAIFLDHLSIIVSEYAAQGGERERIDTVMTKLAKIAKELNVVIFIIVHLRKEGAGRSFEEGGVPSLDDLRGSGSLKQLSWDVLALSRNQQHYDVHCRNISKVTVLKCRFTGRTGEADFLGFDTNTGRMVKVDKPSNYEEKTDRKF